MEEKQFEEMMKDLKENLRLCAGVKLLDHQVENVAYELSKKYQPKLSKDAVILSADEFTNLKKYAYENGSKETAEKIILSEIATIKNIRDACVLPTQKYKEGYIDCCDGILFYIKNNIAKTFGVEV